MALWKSRGTDDSLPKNDRGAGSFSDYGYDLAAKNGRVTLRLADSDPHQDTLKGILDAGPDEITTAVPARSLDEERIDAPIEVRLFAGSRVSGVVGVVPRGLESIVDDNIRRLDDRGDKPRIPVSLVETRHGIRVDLRMGDIR